MGKHPAPTRRSGRFIRRPGAGVAFLCCLATGAAAQETGDWPCIQRKVPHLAVAQLWSGPVPPEDAGWREDPELARLVALIAARRTDLEAVRPMLEALGPAEGQSRDERLVALFAGVFDTIDRERSRIIAGVERYARKQRGLAEQIDAREDTVREAKAAAATGDHDAQDRLEELEDELAWDIRIFQDRRQALSHVCDSPVILERRAFAAAQMIAAQLGR